MKSKKIVLIFMIGIMHLQVHGYNQINKMYHHTAPSNKNESVELGSLVFYFAQEPQIKEVTSYVLANGMKEDIFLLPQTKVAQDIVQKLNGIDNGYQTKMIIERQGLKLIVRYDPNKIGTMHDTFDSIGLQKGLVIRFFNKEFLEKIRKHPTPILQMAALSQKKKLL